MDEDRVMLKSDENCSQFQFLKAAAFAPIRLPPTILTPVRESRLGVLFGSLEKILQVDPVLHRIGPLIMNTICYSLSVHNWSAILAQILQAELLWNLPQLLYLGFAFAQKSAFAPTVSKCIRGLVEQCI